ncbi:hypothetical protein VTO73DRAFT_4575 [Trametes versicolor]
MAHQRSTINSQNYLSTTKASRRPCAMLSAYPPRSEGFPTLVLSTGRLTAPAAFASYLEGHHARGMPSSTSMQVTLQPTSRSPPRG